MTSARLLRRAVAALAVVLSAGGGAPIDAADVQALAGPVNDFAGVLDAATTERLSALSRALEAASGDVLVVATVASVEPFADVREYAVRLFENQGRGIGQRGQDNGVLILLALRERSVRVEVGYALEPWVTDGFAGEISRQVMVPEFRQGRYGAGLLAGASYIAARIADGRGVTLREVDIPTRPVPVREAPVPLWVVLLFFIAIVLLSRHAGGPGRAARHWDRGGWSGWSSGVGPFGGRTWGGGFGGGGGFGRGGGFGGFGGGRSGGGGGGARW